MALSSDQLSDFQGDLGIGDDERVFTDTELDRFYTRAGEDYALAMLMALRQLMADKAKLRDYSKGGEWDGAGQVFTHLTRMYEIWAKEAGGGSSPLQWGVIERDLIEPSTGSEYV